jgi:hypothetical protein
MNWSRKKNWRKHKLPKPGMKKGITTDPADVKLLVKGKSIQLYTKSI